jgi:hypothetical protein
MICKCRFCQAPITQTLVDLGTTPLANSYLHVDDAVAIANERRFPLHVVVCNDCWLVQTTETPSADTIFSHDYAYLSSWSAGWVAHAARYSRDMTARFGLDAASMVVEIASNDGYLLQHFVAQGIPVLGVEPAGHAASLAEEKGVSTQVLFFNEETATTLKAQGFAADLMAANNVLAHVPEIEDFVKGFQVLLKSDGVATFEFPHLASLLEAVQFDTIYHEHYSYLSLTFMQSLMEKVGLVIFDIEKLPTHGGSLRVFVGHHGAHTVTENVARVQAAEDALHMNRVDGYVGLASKVEGILTEFRDFLAQVKAEGKTVAGYGAAAKGNTFINVASLDDADIAFVVDRNPCKQGTLLPGSHIPVFSPDEITTRRPDYLFILPWNIASEVIEQQAHMREWGGQFITAIPALQIH